jgi:hypothetical protein
MASWPTSVKSFSPVVNGVTKLVAALFNVAYDEIEAIETNLSGSVVQVVNTLTNTIATGSSIFPTDGSIPQNDEGTEFMTCAITPKSATNYLLIRAVVNMSHAGAGGVVCGLWQDTTANAMALSGQYHDPGSDRVQTMVIEYYVLTGNTTARTYKIRGSAVGDPGTYTFCPTANYGAVTYSSITITEIRA